MFTVELLARAEELVDACRARGLLLGTAESCTGGLVAALITEIPGSSAMFDRGFVTYSNAAKQAMLDVSAVLLEQHGAVSEPVARAMAAGVLAHSKARIAVSITGVAGPGGGSDAKPVGLVHFGCRDREGHEVHVERRFGERGRTEIRLAAVVQALTMLEDAVSRHAA